jgi:hypothetical protein
LTGERSPIPAVASQLAAMADRAGVHTTNDDPLLELGLAQLHGTPRPSDDWRRFRAGPLASGARGPCWREHPESLPTLREVGEHVLLGKS